MKGMADKMVNNHDLFEALEALERERGVKTEAGDRQHQKCNRSGGSEIL